TNRDGLSQLLRTHRSHLCRLDPRLWDDCDSRHPLSHGQEAESPPPGCDSCWRVDQSLHPSCDLALSLDLGHRISPGAWLWRETRFYFNTTPIVPGVSGVVIEVPVKSGTMLKAGDVLFRIDPTPFENAVKAKEAALADALQTTKQLREASDSAQKKLESALAD